MKLLTIGQQPETIYFYKDLKEAKDLDFVFYLDGNTFDANGKSTGNYEGYEYVLLEEQRTCDETLRLARRIHSLCKGIPIMLFRSYRNDCIEYAGKAPVRCAIEKTPSGEYLLHCGLHDAQPSFRSESLSDNPSSDHPAILQYIAPCKTRRRA
jgi:hypothetical protein